ncbi:unnamed protein product, partial [Protopolystoma xenopodis]
TASGKGNTIAARTITKCPAGGPNDESCPASSHLAVQAIGTTVAARPSQLPELGQFAEKLGCERFCANGVKTQDPRHSQPRVSLVGPGPNLAAEMRKVVGKAERLLKSVGKAVVLLQIRLK